MKQVFLISSNPSGYEEHSIVVGFKETESEAQLAVDELKHSYKTAATFYQDIVIPFLRKFREENPDSHLYNCKIEEIPRWPSGISAKDITPAMREERDAIKLRNQLAIEESSREAEAYRLLEIKSLQPIISPYQEKPWFKKWFDIGEQHFTCSACGLVENNEYYYEPCNEL